MSESSLTLKYLDFCDEACFEYGFGQSFVSLDGYASGGSHTLEALQIDKLVQEGYRQVLNPPVLPGEAGQPSHDWRFLKPLLELDGWVAQAAVVGRTLSWVSADVGSQTTVIETATGTFYPSMVGRTIVTNSISLVITDYVSATQVRVNTYYTAGTWAAAFPSPMMWTMACDGNYRLPDDFGGHEHPLSCASPSQHRHPIPWTGELEIRQQRDYVIDRTGYPRYAAAHPINDARIVTIDATPADSTNVVGYRFDVKLWPKPDTLYTLVSRYRKLVNKLTEAAPYPALGTMQFSELIMASVRATVEMKRFKAKGTAYGHFLERLMAAVADDRRAIAPEYFGQSGEGSGTSYGHDRHSHDNLVVTVNGLIP